MKHFAVTVIISFVAFLQFGSSEPVCHLKEAAACLNKVTDFTDTLERRSLFHTNEDVDRFCNAISETFACIRDYMTRCMTPIQRELMSLVTEGLVDLNKELCDSPTAPMRKNFLDHAECINSIAQAEGTSNSLQYLFAVIEGVMTLPNAQRISYFCCGYDKMYNAIKSEALSSCGEEATKAGEGFVSMAIAELPSLLCSGFDAESEECQAILPPSGSKPTGEFQENAIYIFFFRFLKNYIE